MTLYEAIGLPGAIAVLSLFLSLAAFFVSIRAHEVAKYVAHKTGHVPPTDEGGMEP
jgi:hypothetical protein